MQPFLAPPAPPSPSRPALKDIVSEAARALAQLDAARLEELALSCQALNRSLHGETLREVTRDSGLGANPDLNPALLPINEAERARLAVEARAARREMAVFARVLEATRANVQVIERLRELRAGRLEYAPGPTADFEACWPSKESGQGETGHGND